MKGFPRLRKEEEQGALTWRGVRAGSSHRPRGWRNRGAGAGVRRARERTARTPPCRGRNHAGERAQEVLSPWGEELLWEALQRPPADPVITENRAAVAKGGIVPKGCRPFWSHCQKQKKGETNTRLPPLLTVSKWQN